MMVTHIQKNKFANLGNKQKRRHSQ
jgi:hypothetical protein